MGLVAIVAACAPSPTVPPPVVVGQAVVGSTLTVSNGGWTNGPTSFRYAWRSCATAGLDGCTPVGTAAASYVVAESDVGRFIVASVTATNATGSATRATAPVGPVVDEGGGPTSTDTVDVGGQTVTITVPGGATVIAEASSAPTPPPPPGETFPFGPIALEIGGVDPGAIVPVVLAFESPVDLVRKLIDGEWDPFLFDGLTGVRVAEDGMSMEVRIEDGGRGDVDGVANGVIIDPLQIASASTLTVLTTDLPVAPVGDDYAVDLRTAGHLGEVTWSIIAGDLPPGLELDEVTGAITGTASRTFGGFVRIQATDDQAATTRLFWLLAIDTAAAPTPTGATLSEGHAISALGASPNSGPGWIGVATDEGAFVTASTTSPVSWNSMRGDAVMTSDGRFGYVFFPESAHPIVDLSTGAPVEPTEPFPELTNGIAFSPDGAWMAWREPTATRFIDTATWTTQRIVASGGGPPGSLVWSADSTQLALGTLDPHGDVQIVSRTQSALDRTIDVMDEELCLPGDWSVTNRLSFECPASGAVTTDAHGGSARALAPRPACPDPERPTCLGVGIPMTPKFSPSGAYVVARRLETGQLIVVADSPGAVPVPLNEEWSNTLEPWSWR